MQIKFAIRGHLRPNLSDAIPSVRAPTDPAGAHCQLRMRAEFGVVVRTEQERQGNRGRDLVCRRSIVLAKEGVRQSGKRIGRRKRRSVGESAIVTYRFTVKDTQKKSEIVTASQLGVQGRA